MDRTKHTDKIVLQRRGFLGSAASAIVAPALLLGGISKAKAYPMLEQLLTSSVTTLLPSALKAGSTIGIASPASGVTHQELKDFVEVCRNLQIEVKLGRNVSKNVGYLSAPDADRAAEFMDFIQDPSVDAIVCGRGGYGVMRILPLLDYSAIREAGKIVMGFSDITALLIAINQMSGIVTFHGPVASSTFDEFTLDAVKSIIMSNQSLEIGNSSADFTNASTYSFSDSRITTIHPGIGRGRLTGGNLSMIVSTLGTRYEIDTKGAILFLEEINEEPYKIDRMLTQLWLAGKLQECKGIALGNFRNCEPKGLSISNPSFSLIKVIEHCTADLGIPVVYGMPFGHVRSKMTLPLGVTAELDGNGKSLRILNSAVG
ncbi:MAG: LD-carboxypeptidase [Ignavibacteria bacterium]|nr:LD-carboxypeptidase [Ignavibacteria bacterium]